MVEQFSHWDTGRRYIAHAEKVLAVKEIVLDRRDKLLVSVGVFLAALAEYRANGVEAKPFTPALVAQVQDMSSQWNTVPTEQQSEVRSMVSETTMNLVSIVKELVPQAIMQEFKRWNKTTQEHRECLVGVLTALAALDSLCDGRMPSSALTACAEFCEVYQRVEDSRLEAIDEPGSDDKEHILNAVAVKKDVEAILAFRSNAEVQTLLQDAEFWSSFTGGVDALAGPESIRAQQISSIISAYITKRTDPLKAIVLDVSEWTCPPPAEDAKPVDDKLLQAAVDASELIGDEVLTKQLGVFKQFAQLAITFYDVHNRKEGNEFDVVSETGIACRRALLRDRDTLVDSTGLMKSVAHTQSLESAIRHCDFPCREHPALLDAFKFDAMCDSMTMHASNMINTLGTAWRTGVIEAVARVQANIAADWKPVKEDLLNETGDAVLKELLSKDHLQKYRDLTPACAIALKQLRMIEKEAVVDGEEYQRLLDQINTGFQTVSVIFCGFHLIHKFPNVSGADNMKTEADKLEKEIKNSQYKQAWDNLPDSFQATIHAFAKGSRFTRRKRHAEVAAETPWEKKTKSGEGMAEVTGLQS